MKSRQSVWSQRAVIDYSLARRAALAEVLSGKAGNDDACDAHPYLLRAAKFHGEATETPCPVCRRERPTHVVEVCQGCSWNHLSVSYVLGDGVSRRLPRRQRTAEDDY